MLLHSKQRRKLKIAIIPLYWKTIISIFSFTKTFQLHVFVLESLALLLWFSERGEVSLIGQKIFLEWKCFSSADGDNVTSRSRNAWVENSCVRLVIVILLKAGKTMTRCGGNIADVIMSVSQILTRFATHATFVPTQILCPGHKTFFWKSSETFLVSARRATMLPRLATDGQHRRTQCCRHNLSSFCQGLRLFWLFPSGKRQSLHDSICVLQASNFLLGCWGLKCARVN